MMNASIMPRSESRPARSDTSAIASVPAIEVRELTKIYPARDGSPAVTALDRIDLVQNEGEFVAVMGPSGCGKTTLLNIVAGFERPDSGICKVSGKTVTRAGPDRGVVFQEYGLFPWMTVERNITFALKAAGQWDSSGEARARDILARMGLTNFMKAWPKNLSGGMRQRVAIARILAINSPVMLMDEPFGALDALTRNVLQRELMELWTETHKTILFITHSAEEAIYLADRVLVMTPRPGRVVLDLKIDLDHPRDPTEARFNQYKRDILDVINPALRQDSDKFSLRSIS
jgi:NitT/TauT family transport system ATP-binding protein